MPYVLESNKADIFEPVMAVGWFAPDAANGSNFFSKTTLALAFCCGLTYKHGELNWKQGILRGISNG